LRFKGGLMTILFFTASGGGSGNGIHLRKTPIHLRILFSANV
jgi:hypothetical protein